MPACLQPCLQPCLQQRDRSTTLSTLASCWQWSSVVLWCRSASAATAAGEPNHSTDTHTLCCCSPLPSHFLCLFCRSTSASNNQQFVYHHHNGPILPGCKLHQIVSKREQFAKFLVNMRMFRTRSYVNVVLLAYAVFGHDGNGTLGQSALVEMWRCWTL